jgi:hypothetical protein
LIGQSDNSGEYYSYSTGKVSGGQKGPSAVGGFLGVSSLDPTSFYWDTTTSKTDQGTGEGNIPGLTGLTSTELKSGLPAGFDPAVWREKKNVNHGFPYLINNPPPKD